MKWDLDTFRDYEASIRVTDKEILFTMQGQVPQEMMISTQTLMRTRLSLLVAEALSTEDDKAIMDQVVGYLDCYTKIVLCILPKRVLEQATKPTTSAVVSQPSLGRQTPSQITKFSIGKYWMTIKKQDDYYGKVELRDRFTFYALSMTCIFPISDIYAELPEYLVEIFRSYYPFDKCIPVPNHYLPEIETDEAISRIFFYGVGSIWIEDDKESPDNAEGFMLSLIHI